MSIRTVSADKATEAAASACQAGQAALAARLLEHISAVAAASGENLVFSPLSVHVALALMSAAAAGDTLDEILAFVGAPSRDELAEFVGGTVVDRVLADQSGVGGPSVSFACGAWTDRRWPLRPAYVDTVVGKFKGNTWAVDFRNEVTKGIKTADQRLGGRGSRQQIKVLKLPYEMMDEFNCNLYDTLPKFSMCIFLPSGDKGLQRVVEKIASSPEFLHDHLPTKSVPVGQFRLPKFKLAFERDMAPDLEDLGLKLPFDDEKANMGDMLLQEHSRGVKVNRVIHKAVIEMNEEGSEAAAVTVESDDDLGFSLYGDYDVAPIKLVNFVADHPFAFFIVEEESGSIVFVGHVLDPSTEQ
ncbi:hypothetical protein ACP70R_001773 [Stipagrostis hirtigluma subsp. patula]